MKCTIPEISWHNRDPVLSIDIQPQTDNKELEFVRLATGGTDTHVLIWYLTTSTSKEGSTSVVIASDLTRHEKAVNVVRWSPSGQILASGDDESVIMLWKQRTDMDPPLLLDQPTEQDKETWLTMKILRGHLKDIYDLSWSPNSLFIISGSVDNTAMLWDVKKGRSCGILGDHKNFVQGVAWDPNNNYLATLSSDRTCRVFDVNTRKVLARSSKGKLPGDPEATQIRLYHDDTLQSFFRRLCFSPDGLLLIAPSGGIYREGGKTLHTTYIYSKYSFKQPIIVLPTKEYSVAARCCPVLFRLRGSTPVIPLPYRMIIAIATRSSVVLYDTEQKTPFAIISNIHYTRLTDLSWSSDGLTLAVSSTDGFCSIITFSENELGEIYKTTPVAVTTLIENFESESKCQKDIEMSLKTPDISPAKMPKANPIEIRRKPKSTLPVSTEPSDINTDNCAEMNTVSDISSKTENMQIEDESEKIELYIEDTCTTDCTQMNVEEMEVDLKHTNTMPEQSSTLKDGVEPKAAAKDKLNSPSSTLTPKAPRRVQLITLSSPSSRKQLL